MADIVVINPTQLYVLAKDIGTTNVLFWSRDNMLIGSINLEVVHDLDGLKAKLHQLMPTEPIEVYSAQRSIILSGRASNVSSMNAAVRIADGYLAQIQTAKKTQEFEQDSGSRREDKSVGSVINLIEVGGSQQVMLEVKVAEISRTEMRAPARALQCHRQGRGRRHRRRQRRGVGSPTCCSRRTTSGCRPCRATSRGARPSTSSRRTT